MNLILASSSERRIELLKRITLDFNVIPSDFDEKRVEFKGDVAEYVMTLAEGKAKDVASTIAEKENTFIIGCDTVVAFRNLVLGKPKDEDDAFGILKQLSGNIHNVYTGVVIVDLKSATVKRDYVCTEVKFSNLTDKMIEKYICSGECLDKAGAYGIQGNAAVFVEAINGCFYNVVGLPLNKLNKMFGEMGINL
jgi:septum formation protein